jgi:hypothetical protein
MRNGKKGIEIVQYSPAPKANILLAMSMRDILVILHIAFVITFVRLLEVASSSTWSSFARKFSCPQSVT